MNEDLPPWWISQNALDLIGELRDLENATGFIVSLQEYSPAFRSSLDSVLGRAISSGDDEQLQHALSEYLTENPALLKMSMTPEFWDRKDIDPGDIVYVSGLEMCMEASTLEGLRGWVLDAESGELFLRRAAPEEFEMRGS